MNKAKPCKICSSDTSKIFDKKVLGKYDVSYFKCIECGFIQTEEPYWLNEAYSNAITDLDIGLLSRNLTNSSKIEQIILATFQPHSDFLDYAGGYGVFTRMMRDRGFNFYTTDPYCENLFAADFDLDLFSGEKRFELVTAFELFEHLEDPLKTLDDILKYSDTLIFSTELVPSDNLVNVEHWWYIAPETGQHIAFYTEKSFEKISKQLGLKFYTSGGLHMLTKKEFSSNPLIVDVYYDPIDYNIKMLLQSDFELIKKSLDVSKSKKEKTELNKHSFSDQERLKKLEILLENKEQIANEISKRNKDILKEIRIKSEEIYNLSESYKQLADQNLENETQVKNLSEEISRLHLELDALRNQINLMVNSRGWRFLERMRGYISKFFPIGSFQRRAMAKSIRFARKLLKVPRKTMHVIRSKYNSFLSDLSNKTIFSRKIDIKEDRKKLVYIGHSYHYKTKSTTFLIDYLQEFFDVQVILDESWDGKPFPDISFIDDSYAGVVFFQNLPSDDVLNSINNENLIFFPMFDGHGLVGDQFWKDHTMLKVVNFSSTLHQQIAKLGLKSIAVQYFPDPKEFAKGDPKGVFFWQRITHININVVSTLLGKFVENIHIHKAIDPHHEFTMPDDETANRMKITYSDWFETREEMLDVMKSKAIYIAPREREGIGLSFLEAMAMGKCVIAVDNPTMNEYIKNGHTGFLYDLNSPSQLDLTDISSIQNETYEYMQRGYRRWLDEREKIIKFIIYK